MATAKAKPELSIPEPPKVTLLSDHPAEEELDGGGDSLADLLNLDERMATLYDILRHRETRCPMAIAIYGDWGTGKTSAMRWLAKQLELWNDKGDPRKHLHPKVYPVWFDPWKYRTREDVWRGLIAEIILHCISVSELDRENVMQRMTQAAKQMGRFLGKSFLHALSNIKLKAGKGVEVEVGGQAVRDIVEEWQRTNEPQKAYLNEFEAEVNHWVTAFLPSWKTKKEKGKPQQEHFDRIVLFIDDLDRCLPDVTLEVLEALKLYLNVPHLIFVVGLDRSVVDSVVRKHYTDLGVGGDKSQQYLNKMFQVELDIPPAERVIPAFLDTQIKELDRVTGKEWSTQLQKAGHVDTATEKVSVESVIHEAISSLASSNPRELKRLLNSTLLRARAAMLDSKLEGDSPALRFAQGAQSYLVQRMIRHQFVGEEQAMRLEATLQWLARLSEFICQYPQFVSSADKETGRATDGSETTRKKESTLEDTEVEQSAEHVAFRQLRQDRPQDSDGGPLPIDQIPGVWQLLRIKFSTDVAASSPIRDSGSDNREDFGGDETGKPSRPKDGPGDGSRGASPSFPPTILNQIAVKLGKSAEELNASDYPKVTSLSLSSTQVSDVSSLASLTSLTSLDLRNTQVSDVSSLASLTSLTSLYLSSTQVSDVSSLAGLTSLTSLDLRNTQVSDVSSLASLTSLTSLDLDGTQVSDVSSLAGLTSLTTLDLRNTQVSDVSSLAGLTSLTTLDLRNTQVSDVSSLASLTSLTTLDLSSTQVSDVSSLERDGLTIYGVQ